MSAHDELKRRVKVDRDANAIRMLYEARLHRRARWLRRAKAPRAEQLRLDLDVSDGRTNTPSVAKRPFEGVDNCTQPATALESVAQMRGAIDRAGKLGGLVNLQLV